MKTTILYGSHYFLNAYPIYVYVLIYVFFYSLLWLGRWKFEGRGYDVAYSSKFGDIFLAAFVIIAACTIRQPDFQPSNWMESKIFHLSIAGFSIVASVIYFLFTRPKRVMDIWHALFVVPIFLYLIITTIPVYLQCVDDDGSNLFGFIPLFVWLTLVIYDIKKDRMDQRTWIAKNRPNWRFKN